MSGTSLSCSGATTQRIGQGPGADNVNLTITDGSSVIVTNTNAIALGDNATITLGSTNGTAPVTIRTTTDGGANQGQYGNGDNTIAFGSNSTLIINKNAAVIAAGSQTIAEAANPYGAGNKIINYGLIQGGPSSALFFENVNTTSASPRNLVDNFGTIQLIPTGSVNPVTGNQAVGSSGAVGIDFINEPGAKVIGNLVFQGGDDRVTFNPGSVVTGNINGDGGFNTLTLNAPNATADAFSGQVTNFQVLNKTGPGTWTLTGAVGDNGSTGPLSVNVIGGTLELTGINSNFNGTLVVNPGTDLNTAGPDRTATLSARAQSLPQLITDHGVVLINQVSPDGVQSNDGTYTGLIQGTGVVTKAGIGTLTLLPTLATGNTYSGGTNINVGTLAVSADNALGAAAGPLTFNGGTLRWNAAFALAASRAITLNAATAGLAGGGTFDTNRFVASISQAITGAGGLTVIDSSNSTGQLTLTGANTYTGGTTISSGTLQLGNGGTTGSILGNVANNSRLAFNRADTVLFPGVISGTGSVSQVGGGTTVLSGSNTYTGGTTISGGTLQLGNGGTSGSILGNVTNNAALAFNRSDVTSFGGVISGTGSLAQNGSGTTVLTASSTYSGTTTVNAGTLAVGDATHVNVSLSGRGAVTVLPGATLGGLNSSIAGSVTNFGTVAVGNVMPVYAGQAASRFGIGGNLNNAGVLALGSGSATGNVLAVGGNYTGSGGTVTLNTVLNGGGALANQQTDRLLIEGNATGVTTVRVNALGSGAFTSTGGASASNGISIIQVGGASSPQAFQLAGPVVVTGTPFQYRLLAYGPGSPNGAADPGQSLVGNKTSNYDYRLENALASQPGSPDRPAVAPQVAAYVTAPTALFAAGFQDIDFLHRRLGEIRDTNQTGRGDTSEVFVRAYGGNYNYASTRSFAQTGFNSAQDYEAIQFGGNLFATSTDDGNLRVGLAGSLGRLWISPDAPEGNSKGLFNTEKLYATVTYQARAGWYVDGVVSGGLLDGRISTPTRGRVAGLNGTSFSASVEAGMPFALPWQKLEIEPQVQLVYQRLDIGRRTDIDGINVAIGSPDQGLARVGARLKREFQTDGGTVMTPYLKANLIQGLGDSGKIQLSNTGFGTGSYGTVIQVGGGVTGTLTQKVSLYGDVAWQHNVGDGGLRGWSFNGGVRFAFGGSGRS